MKEKIIQALEKMRSEFVHDINDSQTISDITVTISIVGFRSSLVCLLGLIDNHNRIRSPNKAKINSKIDSLLKNEELNDFLTAIIAVSPEDYRMLFLTCDTLVQRVDSDIAQINNESLHFIDI